MTADGTLCANDDHIFNADAKFVLEIDAGLDGDDFPDFEEFFTACVDSGFFVDFSAYAVACAVDVVVAVASK